MTGSRVKAAKRKRRPREGGAEAPAMIITPQGLRVPPWAHYLTDELRELRHFLVDYLTSRPDPLPPPELLDTRGELVRLRLELAELRDRVHEDNQGIRGLLGEIGTLRAELAELRSHVSAERTSTAETLISHASRLRELERSGGHEQ